MLPRRSPSNRVQRLPNEVKDSPAAEARRQIAQVLALIRAAEEMEPPCPVVDAQNEELARSLHQLEAKLAEREREVAEKELRLADRERDQAETNALLQHREALLAAARKLPVVRAPLSVAEHAALLNLKGELDRQEASLREHREALREREKFIEDSERRLFEKVQEQQEKEMELEQREEESQFRALNAAPVGADAPPAVKKTFDEFTE
ncbi:hypothetical protein [Rariglobus hedericola]|uniref:hypothetical protein n=1 Tax=Rariglobus hedericola TaxID=2597822 RepID=UPI001396A1E6|nr:hypothetical protein [Rariglobus hedericola]